MLDFDATCPVCLGLLDEEDLFCSNCGRSTPPREEEQTTLAATEMAHHFTCTGCGASMSYDASAGTLRCPFCGSDSLKSEPIRRSLRPHRVLPFGTDRAQADRLLREWLREGIWRPSQLVRDAVITKLVPVYAPYWNFSAKTLTYWTADRTRSSSAPGRGTWYPVSGEHDESYRSVLVGASSVLTPNETESLCPFELSHAVSPEDVDLDNVVVEQFTVPRKYARPLARQQIEQAEAAACKKEYLTQRHRNLRVNVRLHAMRSEPILLPIWVVAYRYRDTLYRILINGQTGATTGTAPVSHFKVSLAVLAVCAIFMLILALIASTR